MTTIPLGAAAYSRFSSRIDKTLGYLFHAGLIYLIATTALFLKYVSSWVPAMNFNTTVENLLFYNLVHLVCGVVIFSPLWFTVGILEMNLYQVLSQVDKDIQWISYLFGVLGLLLGLFISSYGLPVQSPFWLGVLLSTLFLVYLRMSALRFTRKTALIMALAVVMLATNSYVKNPVSQVKKEGAPEIKADIWGRTIRLTIVKSKQGLFGFYNSTMHWFPYVLSLDAFKDTPLYEKLALLMPQDATIAVIGAGGGKQLVPFLLNKPNRIYAVDIVPGLFDTLINLGATVFEDPRISFVVQDGRKFLEKSHEKFDLICFPRTDSILMLNKSLFEPSQLLFTRESLQTYREKLKSEGILVITKWKNLFDVAHSLSNYVATLEDAGFEVNCYSTEVVVLILAGRDRKTVDKFAQVLKSDVPSAQGRGDIAAGEIIVDDKPFYASIFPRSLFRAILICIAIFLLIIFYFFSRYSEQKQLLLSPFLCGVNYTLILLAFQLLLFFQLSNPLDTSMVGNFIFLALVFLGGASYQKRIVLGLVILCGIIGWLFLGWNFSLLLLGFAAIISGGFFPRLLQHFHNRLPFLLILDGLGAAVAGGIYLVVATIWGIRILLVTVMVIFVITYLLVKHIQIITTTGIENDF